MSGLFEPPAPLVLRDDGNRRTAIAFGTFIGKDGEQVGYVRVGVQYRAAEGDWRWSKGEGATIPLRRLGEVARWLIDCARAVARPDSTSDKPAEWSR